MKAKLKMLFPFILVLCGVLLFGCGKKEAAVPEMVPAEESQQTLPAAGDWDIGFLLPEGFALEPQEGGYVITHNGQEVGGLAKSDLIKTDLIAYLQTYVQPPLVMEYIYCSGKDNVWNAVDLIAYDPETRTAHEVSHYLFEKDGEMYDLFLDNELVEWETEKLILETSGLYLPEE